MPDRRTYQDRKEALKLAVIKRRKKIKQLSIEYKGGKCQLCGYNRCEAALELHHLNPLTKSFGIGEKGYTRAWTKVRAELDKCILLCANCHREVEAGILQLPGESLVEKQGEFGETPTLKQVGNPEPSLIHDQKGVETIPNGSSSQKCARSALSLTLLELSDNHGNNIVRPF